MSCPKKLGVGCLSFRTELHAYSRYQYFCYWHHFALVSPLLLLSIHIITVSIVIKKFCILVKVAIRIMKNLHHAILFSIYFHDDKLTHCLWGSGCLWALKYLMGFSKKYLSTGRRVLQLVGKHFRHSLRAQRTGPKQPWKYTMYLSFVWKCIQCYCFKSNWKPCFWGKWRILSLFDTFTSN